MRYRHFFLFLSLVLSLRGERKPLGPGYSYILTERMSFFEEISQTLAQDSSTNLAEIKQGIFQDAKTIIGKKITLRTSDQIQESQAINLVSFDPNFTSAEVVCRYKDCPEKNPDLTTKERFGTGKRDLYLCPKHHGEVTSKLTLMCQKNKEPVDVSRSIYRSGDLSWYTDFIPVLEKLYHEAVKGSPLQEAYLHARNAFLITNALLNPDQDNLRLIVPLVLEILQAISKTSQLNPVACANLVCLLRDAIKEILSAFGVTYSWVESWVESQTSPLNPGAQIGTGVGGILGLIGGIFGGPAAAAVGSLAVAAFGGLIGNGVYNLVAEQHSSSKQCFRFEANASGDLGMLMLNAP